jgi:hypothetical protein
MPDQAADQICRRRRRSAGAGHRKGTSMPEVTVGRENSTATEIHYDDRRASPSRRADPQVSAKRPRLGFLRS